MAARGVAAPWASVPPARLPACGPEVHDASISPAFVGHQPLLRVLGDARRAQRGREAVMGGVTVRLRKVGHGTEGTRGRLDGTRRLHWMRGWHCLGFWLERLVETGSLGGRGSKLSVRPSQCLTDDSSV